MKKFFVGLDIGTTSTKAVVFDAEGTMLYQTNANYGMMHPQTNWSEQNPVEIYEAVRICLKNVAAKNLLETVSFSSAMHSLMAVDESGTPLSNLIIWADNRAEKIASKLKKSALGKKIYDTTGTPIHASSFLAKILWLKKNEPAMFKKAYKFIGIKEFIWYKLTGTFQVDHSIASTTGLMDNIAVKWDENILSFAGISTKKLSAIVDIKSNVTISAGHKKEINYVIGASDGCLASLGTNAINENNMALSIGTSGALRICKTDNFVDPKMETFKYLLNKNQYIIGGATNNGAVVLEWLRNEILKTNKSLNDLLADANSVPAGAENLLFLPYVLGERAPVWNSNATGIFFGLNICHTQSHLVRAVAEGIILNLYSIGKKLLNLNPIDTIYASGGFAKSTFWVQLIADIFQLKVIVSENIEGSAWGAAMLAIENCGKGTPAFKGQKNKIFMPNIQNKELYLKKHIKFESLYKKLSSEF